MGTQINISRNDDLLEAQESLHAIRPPRDRGKLATGWLQPFVCWALYKQFGVLRQLVTKISNQVVSKGWKWSGDGMGFDWTGVSSDLETLGFQGQLKKAIKWAHVEGGAGLVFRLDEVRRTDLKNPDRLAVVPANVRGIERIDVYVGTKLRPMSTGAMLGTWDTCEHFEVIHAGGRREIIHRSRVVPVVVDDIPMDAGHSTLYNSTTGWPPSWLDGVIDSLQSWRDAESTTDNLLYTISLLILEMNGTREAYSGSAAELAEFKALIQGIADTLTSHGVMALPPGDKLGEVGRSTSGVDKLLEQKKDTFVSDTGYSAGRVLMKTVGGLGDAESGPRLNDLETLEGIQESTVTPAVNRATEFILMGYAKQFGQAVPSKWVIEFNPLSSESSADKAKTRDSNAKARKADMDAGVPLAALLSDPELDEHYPKLAEITAAQAAAQAEAESAAANEDPSRPPTGEELVSAAEVGRRLGVSAASVLAMRARGSIRGWKVANRWRFSWSQVQAAIVGSLGAVEGEGGEVAEDARAARVALRRGDAVEWGRLGPVLGFDALPPGMELSEATNFGSVFGESEAMREVFTVLERVAPTDIPVLVLGETGTGKEGVARGLHEVPGRAGPFVAINCAAVGDDADDAAAVFLGDGGRPGVFEQANGGTLFLDEVGELSDEGQAVLLRALSGEVRFANGAASVRVRVRIVAATWKGLGGGDFRRDLFERLAGVVVEVPPLRDRGADMEALAAQFLAAESAGLGTAPVLSADALAVMRAHRWPGNIRELRNAIRRAVLFAGDGGVIEPEHLQLHAGRE